MRRFRSKTHARDLTYSLLDADGKSIRLFEEVPCYSAITYNKIPDAVATIKVSHPLANIPYAWTTISAWIRELNTHGFPCRATKTKTKAHFWVELKDYQFKIHLSCTLQLIRCLFEEFIWYVPELYFRDKNPDRFAALQDAHKELHDHQYSRYFNSNHTVTDSSNANIARDVLFKRFEANGVKVFDDEQYGRIDNTWDGREPDPEEFLLKP